MASITPRGLWVPGPAPRPRRGGLLTVAQVGDTSDPHWQAGLEFEDTLCVDIGATLSHCGDPSPDPMPKDPEGGPLFRQVDPFTLYGSYFCAVPGRPAQDAFDIAIARLNAKEEYGVERTFWTGVTPDGTLGSSLADGDAAAGIAVTDLTGGGGALDPITAMDVLEEAMGNCVPGQGVIHVPDRAASTLGAAFLLLAGPDGTYTTHLGNPVIFGAGYPGTGPANAVVADDETWLFGTGQVMVWQSEMFLTPELVPQAVDKVLNDVTVFAEKTYAVGFSCCVFAVRMFLSCCLGGS